MKLNEYLNLKANVIEQGFEKEYEWAQGLEFPDSSNTLCFETIHVICNSGMKYSIAQQIYSRIIKAIADGVDVGLVFKNKNKLRAIRSA